MIPNIHEALIHQLAGELTAPKRVTQGQMLSLARHYSVGDFDALKALVDQKSRENSTLDLFMILSYHLTPNLEDRARYSGFLDDRELTSRDVSEIIRVLANRDLSAELVFAGDSSKVRVPLVEEVIARYVRNLHLDVSLPDRLRKIIGELIPDQAQALVKAVFRDEVWQKEPWKEEAVPILYSLSHRQFRAGKLIYLTSFLASNRPKDRQTLRRLLSEVIGACEAEVRRLDKGGKMFFNETIRENYDGTESDQRAQELKKLEEQREELTTAIELAQDLMP